MAEISRGQFENAFAGERNRMQQQLGDQYSELAANEGYMKNLRQQTLNRLIDEALLDQYAKSTGLGISDEQVKKPSSRRRLSSLMGSSTTRVTTALLTRWV